MPVHAPTGRERSSWGCAMAFWSGEQIRQHLEQLIDKPNPEHIDCAAYTLCIGREYYVSPTDRTPDPRSRSLRQLQPAEAFAIPPGQFAYLQTEEIVTVPPNVLGFISIRARVKWKGLVNVSGFHVDPGFQGRLTFAVFNAGPSPIHLRQGESVFLIWFSDLDRTSLSIKADKPQTQIDLNVLNSVSGELHSFEGLAERLRTAEKELSLRISSLERRQGTATVAASVVLTLLVGLAVKWAVDTYEAKVTQPSPAMSRTAPPVQ
jgi:dCTP deaminase